MVHTAKGRLNANAETWSELARSVNDFAADLARALAKGGLVSSFGENSGYLAVLDYDYEIRKMVAREAVMSATVGKERDAQGTNPGGLRLSTGRPRGHG